MSIHSNLRQLRIDRGMTQEQVAGKVGITRQALSSYESGRTRPDIDMLMRLCEVYETDMDGILYGQSRSLKSMRRIKASAAVVFILLTALTAVSSALLWSANRFFPIPEGTLSPDGLAALSSHLRLTDAWEILDKIILSVSPIGFLLLATFILLSKCTVPLKCRLIYMAVLSVSLLAISSVFGITDDVFSITNYITTPLFVIARMAEFFILVVVIEFIQKLIRKRSV